VYPPIVDRQRLGKHVPAATNTRNNRRIVGRVVFYTVRVVSKEGLWICLSPIFECAPPKGEGSQSRQTVKYGHESRGARNQESLCWRGPAAIYWTGLCIPIPLPGNGSVNTFLRQRRIVGAIVFCAVRVVSKESRRLVLTRTSRYFLKIR
jgi:hypothetical protein